MDRASSIGENLKVLRGNKTQKEFAEFLEMPVSTYAMYELGQRVPRDDVKIKIAKKCKKSVQAIFFAN